MGKRISLVVVQDCLGRILLLKRSATDEWMPGYWALPGGHVNFLESYKNAAKRELKEETNLIAKEMVLVDKKENHQIWLVYDWSGQVDLEKASHGFEHSAFTWMYPEEILSHPKVVPELKSWQRLMYLENF